MIKFLGMFLLILLSYIPSTSQTFKNYISDSAHFVEDIQADNYKVQKIKLNFHITWIILQDSTRFKVIFADMSETDLRKKKTYTYDMYTRDQVMDEHLATIRVVGFKAMSLEGNPKIITFGFSKRDGKLEGIGISNGESSVIYWCIPSDADKRYHQSQKQKKFGSLNKKT